VLHCCHPRIIDWLNIQKRVVYVYWFLFRVLNLNHGMLDFSK